MKLNGLILFIVATILGIVLLPPFLLSGVILTKSRNEYLFKIALSIDILGNVVGGPLFNRSLILSTSHQPFGGHTHTISYVIAVNKYHNNLTKAGIILANILDTIDPGHTDLVVQRAIRIKLIN